MELQLRCTKTFKVYIHHACPVDMVGKVSSHDEAFRIHTKNTDDGKDE